MHFVKITTAVDMKDVFSDLCKLKYEWHGLGIQLGVYKPQLTKQDYQQIDGVFLPWSDRVKPTWLKVVCALMEKGKTLAYRVAQEYGTFCCVFVFFTLSHTTGSPV